MKLDDRDIICQQDYAPLSNAELLTQIEENLEWLRGAALFDTERVMGPVRAALARAEAAEAEVVDLHRQLAEMAAAMEEIEDERLALLARVAELEATLAAQGWRPVTEKPVADDEYLVWCSSYEGCEIQSYSSRLNRWYSNAGNDADYWRPLPPDPQEPTR